MLIHQSMSSAASLQSVEVQLWGKEYSCPRECSHSALLGLQSAPEPYTNAPARIGTPKQGALAVSVGCGR